MTKKIDEKLLYSFSCSDEKRTVKCLVYCYNLNAAKSYFFKNKTKVLGEYLFIKALMVEMKKEQILETSAKTFVSYLSSVSKVSALMNLSKQILGIRSCKFTGKDITIAYIDTGLYSHPDFKLGKDRVKFFKDFINSKSCNYDDNGHGTFVAGVGSGSGYMSALKFSGVAPKSNIISLKALDGKGEASAEKILDAMQWVYDNHKKFNIKIVCMSFGSEPLGFNDPIMRGAEALWKDGVIVCAAAGNSGPEMETIKSPGISSLIITVGGFNDNRIDDNTFDKNFFEIADFSSRGPALRRFKPDIVAPSVGIISCGIVERYIRLSGTSVATPMVAGMCALILEKNKNISPDDVKRKLLSSATAITYNRNIEGYGIPDLMRFMNS